MAGGRDTRARTRGSSHVNENNGANSHPNNTNPHTPLPDETNLSDHDDTDEASTHQDEASSSALRATRKRGPTMGKDLWACTNAIKKVVYDKDGQPVAGEANSLTTFLGCLARNGEFFPISTPTWSDMSDDNLNKAWDEIQKRFTTDHPNARRKIMSIMNGRWRDWKSHLKKNHFVPGDRSKSIENTSGVDRVNPNQWAPLVDYWLTDDAQKIATQNRANRNKLLIGHTLGTKSIPKKKYELYEKDKIERDRADMYVISHTRKDKSILQGATPFVQKINELKEGETSSGGTQSTGRNDILAQVFGPERHGRLRQGGIGATATNTWGTRNAYQDIERENQELRAELQTMRSKLTKTDQKVDQMQEIIQKLVKGLPTPNDYFMNQDRSSEEDGSDRIEDL